MPAFASLLSKHSQYSQGYLMKAPDLGDPCKWRLLFSIFYQWRTPIHLSCFALRAGEHRMWQQLQQANNELDKKVEICQPKQEHVQWDLSSGPRSSSECQSLDNMNSYGTVWPIGCTSSTSDHSSFDSWYLIRRQALLLMSQKKNNQTLLSPLAVMNMPEGGKTQPICGSVFRFIRKTFTLSSSQLFQHPASTSLCLASHSASCILCAVRCKPWIRFCCTSKSFCRAKTRDAKTDWVHLRV